MSLVLMTLLLVSCEREAVQDTDTDTDVDTDTDTDADTDTDTDTDTDPDNPWGLDEDPACEGYEGTAIPGATRYFLGDYILDGGTVTGTERAVYLANDEWERLDGESCQIVWDMWGDVGGTASCATCDYSLSVSAMIVRSQTDCPDGLWVGDEDWSITYDVRLLGDGTARFYFATSGDEVGRGYHEGDEIGFTTDPACAWF